MPGLTYGSGALIAAERNNRRFWARHALAVQHDVEPVVPVAVLAQVWRGGPQANLSRLLGDCHIEPMLETHARDTGVALARSGTSDVPDAALVMSALRQGNAIVTGDRQDLERMAQALGRRLSIIDV